MRKEAAALDERERKLTAQMAGLKKPQLDPERIASIEASVKQHQTSKTVVIDEAEFQREQAALTMELRRELVEVTASVDEA